MPLIDDVNKVIYWDEVNWLWLPYVKIKGKGSNVSSKEGALKLISNKGYSFSSLDSLGIVEISLGCYLYEEKIYQSDSSVSLRSLASFLAMVFGKSRNTLLYFLKGKGVISKKCLEGLNSSFSAFEFRGKSYQSYAELSREYGFSISYISQNIARGFSLDEIVERYENRGTKLDHLGNKFNSIDDMCKHWGITVKAYKNRRDSGWSLEKRLTIPIKDTQVAQECVDFKGNVFPSIKRMAEEYGINPTNILYHVKKGKTPAEALKYLLTNGKAALNVQDHLGNYFSSYKEMADYHGINVDTLRDRLKGGASIEESLSDKLRINKKISKNAKKYKDHLGNFYSSKSKMAENYGVSMSTFCNRLQRGWSLEEALTGKKKKG